MNIKQRMLEIMQPIEASIMMTDSNDELLMLACAMVERSAILLQAQLGVSGQKEIFRSFE
jgi:hypothetical protein